MIGHRRHDAGFTLFELLITIAILGIVAALAAPYMGNYVERQRLIGATEAVYGQLQQAKRAAISNNRQVYFTVASAASASWCAGFGDSAGCDCKIVSSCQVNGQDTLPVTSEDYPGIRLLSKSTPALTTISTSFIMPGISANNDTLVVRSDELGDVEVIISPAGRVRVCSDVLSQYPDC
jgi:type IV fimbrial biogenesis protein FimT